VFTDMSSNHAQTRSPSSVEARPIRVTHVVHDFEGGGLETLVADMARGFDAARVRTSIVSLSGRIGRLGHALTGVVHGVHALKPAPLVSMVLPLGLARHLRRSGTQIVHVHSGVWFKAAVAARFAGVDGVVFTEHGREHADPPVMRFIDGRAARLTDAVVAVSGRLERYLADRVGVPPGRLMTIENGVDTNRFRPGTPRRDVRGELGIPADALVVGSVGRLEHVKAYERALYAVAAVRARGGISRPVYLVLFGDGSQRQPLTALADSLGLGDAVRFPGWVSEPDDVYRMMDVFVLPSHSEGLSVSLLEAMATGVVPLVTPVGANPDVLRDTLASQVVSAEEPGRFADALYLTLASDTRRQALATAAREVVLARFSQTRMLDAYTTLYERLVERRAVNA
jgi:glycosyltransferase involved in cell wall biosynthesis